jgi:predicted membrane metal-binding protein
MGAMSDRKLPPWMIGLILAIVLFALALAVSQLLGFGDDPSFGN